MTRQEQFISIIKKHQHSFHSIVSFDPKKDKLLALDFTENNQDLTAEIIENTEKFTAYIKQQLQTANCQLGIGGYAEYRTVYNRSRVFDADKPGAEPRRVHLGADIWGPAGTQVFTPLGGRVYSYAFNKHFGDYGVTIILIHQLDSFSFYTLYGHLSLKDISNLKEGHFLSRGTVFAHFSEPEENGHWPPHLHFQIIFDMGIKQGDYPGVCKFSEREKYLSNCPDPDLILQMNQYLR